MRHAAAHAEWALKGKTSSDRGYRLLNWSEAQLSDRNFAQLLDRYSPGVLAELPQVTVSYAKSELHQQYIALAIHHTPPDGRVDPDNRPVLFTSYFCVPYGELAGYAVSYLALYDAFRKVGLPEAAGDQPPRPESRLPLAVRLAVHAPERPGKDDLALTVAALLLTSRPVCVLGAEQVPVADRLRFIDRVMSLLPYGLRPRMSAATWASRNYASHKFRLFFSDTPRDADEPDHIVTWGAPASGVPHDHPRAKAYLDWLIRLDLPVERLATYTTVLGFGEDDIDTMNRQLGITQAPAPRGHEGRDPKSAPDAPGRPSLSPEASPAADIELILASGNVHLIQGDARALREDIDALREGTAQPEHLTEERRAVYREKIALYQFFPRIQDLSRPLEMAFYDVLLRAGFGLPLTYAGYQQLEECLGGQRPHSRLLQAILDGSLMPDDGQPASPVVPILVRYYLGDDRAVWKWLRSSQVDVRQLLHALAGDWKTPEHADIIFGATMALIRDLDKKGRLPDLRPTLKALGFLETAVQRRHPDQPREQVALFRLLLHAAYRAPLTADDAAEVLAAGIDHPVPNALFYAVMLMMDPRGGDVDEVTTEFVRVYLGYVISNSGLDPESMRQLESRMLDSGSLYRGHARGTSAIEAPSLAESPVGLPALAAQPPEQPRGDDHEEDQESRLRPRRGRGRGIIYPEWRGTSKNG